MFRIAITVAVVAGAGGYASFADGFGRAMVVAAALSLTGALVGLALPARRATAPIPALAET